VTEPRTPPANVRLSADDRWEISDVLARYCVALDDRRLEDLEMSFTPDLEWDYEGFGTGTDLDSLREMIRTALIPITRTQHATSATQLVTPTSEGAAVRSYILAQHVRPGAPAGHLFMIAGWYFDDLVQTPDGWRIARRRYENVWMEGNPAMFEA
jgi:3-phenylpropionate/cinnamic acid dioxygenase small subunit